MRFQGTCPYSLQLPKPPTSLLCGPSSTSRCHTGVLPSDLLLLFSLMGTLSVPHMQSRTVTCKDYCIVWGNTLQFKIWMWAPSGSLEDLLSRSLLSDLLHTPLFHVLPSAEAEVFVSWLLVRDVSPFCGMPLLFLLWDYGGRLQGSFGLLGEISRCFLLSFDASFTEGHSMGARTPRVLRMPSATSCVY